MDYKLIKNQAKESMKGFKGQFFGLLAITVGIQTAINIAIGYILPENIILPIIIGTLAQALIIPSLIGIVRYAVQKKERANYSFRMPTWKIILDSLGVIVTNTMASQAIIAITLIPGIIIAAFLMTIAPIEVAGIFLLVGIIAIGLLSTFIHVQVLLGISEIVDGKGFVDSMTHSWSALIKNFKFFIRVSLIMAPIVLIPIGLIVGLLVIALIGTVAYDLGIGLISIFFVVFPIMIIATIILAIVLVPKLFSVTYIGYEKIKETENGKDEKINLDLDKE